MYEEYVSNFYDNRNVKFYNLEFWNITKQRPSKRQAKVVK